MTRRKLWTRLATAAVLAVGLNIAWALLCGWLTAIWQTNFQPVNLTREQLIIDQSGQPLVHVAQYGQVYRESYRKLDGTPLPDMERPPSINPAYLTTLPPPKHWYDPPRRWSSRLIWATEAYEQGAGAYWYLIQEPGVDDKLYLAGYDEASRASIGFIGRTGFSTSIPEPANRFFVGEDLFRYYWQGTRVAGSSLGSYSNNRGFDQNSNVPPWCLYVLHGDRLVEVDLRARAVRDIAAAPQALSLSRATLGNPAPESDESAAGRQLSRIAVRYQDHVTLVDPSTSEGVDFKLPQSLWNRDELYVYAVSDNQVLVCMGNPYSDWQHRILLYRIDRDGNVLEQTPIDLAGPQPVSDTRLAIEGGVMLPAPLAWTVIALGAGPIGEFQQRRASDYPEAVAGFADRYWPAYVIALLAGAASALVVVRLQRRYYRDHTRSWSIATLLGGPAMLLAYLAEHRRPATAACPSCGRPVPHTRDACPACEKAFPAPAVTGIEVFA